MVQIVTDTTCGLPLEVAREFGIPMLPQIIVFGESSYRDDMELDTATALQKLRRSAVLPKTSAPPPGLYGPLLAGLLVEGHTILCLHPSAEVSGALRSAEVAAQDSPGADIRVIDTRTIAAPLASEFEQGLGLARVPVYELPPAIVVHGGPGVLTASFFTTT